MPDGVFTSTRWRSKFIEIAEPNHAMAQIRCTTFSAFIPFAFSFIIFRFFF